MVFKRVLCTHTRPLHSIRHSRFEYKCKLVPAWWQLAVEAMCPAPHQSSQSGEGAGSTQHGMLSGCPEWLQSRHHGSLEQGVTAGGSPVFSAPGHASAGGRKRWGARDAILMFGRRTMIQNLTRTCSCARFWARY